MLTISSIALTLLLLTSVLIICFIISIDVVEAIFATSNRDEAEAIIEEFSKFWMSIIGTRGATGKKTVNAQTQFNALFDDADSVPVAETDTEDLQESKLEELENEQK